MSVLSRREFDSFTDLHGSPTLLHLLRFDVPALIETKELHLMPNQLMKSRFRPLRMKTMANLSDKSVEAGWDYFRETIGGLYAHGFNPNCYNHNLDLNEN